MVAMRAAPETSNGASPSRAPRRSACAMASSTRSTATYGIHRCRPRGIGRSPATTCPSIWNNQWGETGLDGVAPLDVLHAYVAAMPAFIVFAIPAARQQGRASRRSERKQPRGHSYVHCRASIIVALILAGAVAANVYANRLPPGQGDAFPYIGATVIGIDPVAHALAPARLERGTGGGKGAVFLLSLVLAASMMPVEQSAGASSLNALRPRFRLGGLRQHSADEAGARAGRLRLGRAGLRRGLRRLDDLVRLVSRGRGFEPVPRSQVRRPVAAPRLARRRGVRRRLLVLMALLGWDPQPPIDSAARAAPG